MSYQILSALSGGIFVLLLLLYARNVFPAKPLSFFLMIVSGGLFLEVVGNLFGDVAGMVPDPLQMSRDENIGNHGL